jgi:hypothetical protein
VTLTNVCFWIFTNMCIFLGGVGEYSFAISTSTSGSRRRRIFGVRCFTSQSYPLCAGNSFLTKKGFVQELGFLC